MAAARRAAASLCWDPAQGTPCSGNWGPSPPPTRSSRGENPAPRGSAQGHGAAAWGAGGRVSIRGTWEKLITFSPPVRRWRESVVLVKQFKKTGLFAVRVLSKKRGQVQLSRMQSCSGREANEAASIHLCTQGAMQGQQQSDGSVSLAVLALPPLQPLNSS